VLVLMIETEGRFRKSSSYADSLTCLIVRQKLLSHVIVNFTNYWQIY